MMGTLPPTSYVELASPLGAWLAAAACAIFIGLAVRDAMQVAAKTRGLERLWLLGLRSATVAFALVLIVQPQWVSRHLVSHDGPVAVLLDASGSMALSAGDGSRAAGAQRALLELSERVPASATYFFGEDLRPTVAADALAAYPTSDGQSDLLSSIEQVVAEAGQPLGAVVVVSDGADSAPERLATELAGLGTRVHTVYVGGRSEGRDDAIVDVKADTVAFLRQQAEVEVQIRRDPAQAGSIPVSLLKDDQLVAEVMANIDADGNGRVVVPFDVTALGRAAYTVRIPTAADDRVPDNNGRPFLMNVTRDRMRVLLVGGRPGWDSHFLRAFLKARPSIDLITFFILRTASDMSMAAPDELSLIPFPTDELFREHLSSFDLVIFQDFDFGPYQMARYLPRVRDYVRAGGSFAMVGGELSFSSGGYANTPVAEILPVALPASAPFVDSRPFRPVIADGAASHPLVALLPQPAANLALWSSVAPLAGANIIGAARPDATVLLRHPERRGPTGAKMPVLVVGAAGQGRSMALAADSAYRWGFTTAGATGDASIYERFWDRSLRWLTRDPFLEPSDIQTDAERYVPGAGVAVRYQARGTDYRAARASDASDVRMVLRAGDNEIQSWPLAPGKQGRGHLEIAAPGDPGAYMLALLIGEDVAAEQAFVVEIGGQEFANSRPNRARLQEIARATGGEFFDGSIPASAEIPRETSVQAGGATHSPLASPFFFFGLVATFFAEWALRRRAALR